MRISEETLENFEVKYPLEKIGDPERILFIDIETTGFTARSSCLYLIGCTYYQTGKWHVIQWFAENHDQEADLLNAFFQSPDGAWSPASQAVCSLSVQENQMLLRSAWFSFALDTLYHIFLFCSSYFAKKRVKLRWF